ncbi:presenilin family intramembrane aspartyl protease [Halobacteria archaeon AArc-dxtr1]|nr:presenilin family intramembrane aspartyl protease [Halobacteria archaeon AArc-dxtr1]
MTSRARLLAAVGVVVGLFLAVQLGALALAEPFYESEHQAVENPDDPANSAIYVGIILVATAMMLAAFKYDAAWLIRALIVGVSGMLAWFVFAEFLPPIVTVGGINGAAVLGAVAVSGALLAYPEWYVIDLTGVLIGAGAAALFGISFGLLPAILLLLALAVYDAISVYKTEHMLDLAAGVMELKIPVVLVVPTALSYSHLDAVANAETETDGGAAETVAESSPAGSEGAAGDAGAATTAAATDSAVGAEPTTDEKLESTTTDEEGDREAFFIGLGDAVIPTILVVSAVSFLDAGTIDVPGLALNVPALGALVGTLVGLLVLMSFVMRGRPHAGLPLLNGGAIGGYLVGALASGVSIATALGL